MNELRNNWTVEEVEELFDLPFNDLIFRAHQLHRENFQPNEVQISTLLSIKTGACPEDCSYCSQSAINDTGLEKERLLELEAVKSAAAEAKANAAINSLIRDYLSDKKKSSMYASQYAMMIREFKEHPEKFKIENAPKIPDGSPIGSDYCNYTQY